MISVAEIKADLELLRTSQVTKQNGGDPLLMGIMVQRQQGQCKLTSFDGMSSTTISDRDWGESIPEGGFVLPAGFARLFSMLGQTTKVSITKVKTGQIEVKQGASKWRFPMSLKTDSFYPIGEEVLSNRISCTSLEIDGDLFREALLNVFPSIGKEYSALCCAKFVFKPQQGELIAMANDSRRSTVWKAVNVKYPNLLSPEYQFILPGAKLLALAKFMKATPKVDIHFTDSLAVFENTEAKTSFSVRLLDGRDYPPILSLFQIPFTAGYTIQPKEILASLKRIKLLLPENKLIGSNTLELRFENELVTLTHESDLFTEQIPCRGLVNESEETEIKNPSVFESRLNLDYLHGALSILIGSDCDIKLHQNIVSISSNTLAGVVTHFIATVGQSK